MLVVLDANAIVDNPLCNGSAWKVLALGAEQWGITLIVPKAVIVEAVAGFGRRCAQAARDWKKVRPYLPDSLDAAVQQELDAAVAGYEQTLTTALAAHHAVITDYPEVPHQVLVERAAQRRAPCDVKGDGYRDTLLWLGVLELLAEYPGEQLVLVSADNDFRSDKNKRTQLHPDLVDDLASADAAGRVELVDSLGALILRLADAPATSDLGPVRDRIHEEVLRAFIDKEVLRGLLSMIVDPAGCGLVTIAEHALISGVGTIKGMELEFRAELGDQHVVKFAGTMLTTFIPLFPLQMAEHDTSPITRNQTVAGLIALGEKDRPVLGAVTHLAAPSDDAIANAWREAKDSDASALILPSPADET